MAENKGVKQKIYTPYLNTGTPSGDLIQRLNPCEIARFCRQSVGKFSLTAFRSLLGLEAVFFVGGEGWGRNIKPLICVGFVESLLLPAAAGLWKRKIYGRFFLEQVQS